ncbi:nucleotide sugar dehydrogenase [Pseudochrobactrum kiredjianiae]|uniref:Nucleotide sugar dehydrogenase n=1 Tax=Pseudochrobactrum kiredjianiae TaxID=386305 RepID=A0ABW3UYR4_9HYPH|nr:nucleotide sugar dehydrogenase [Pseudochrobactrum kiredjianiae]MDM7852525.1 nucleotide sugar dehydrogenase [Pseudochrobactrum kiredjianiae]
MKNHDRNSTGLFHKVAEKIRNLEAVAGVIGLGYVGLPLAAAMARSGFRTIGFDIDADKVSRLNKAESYIDAVTSEQLSDYIRKNLFRATCDSAELADCDVIIICVPTPLSKQREPDLSYIVLTARMIAKYLREGQLIVLESTTYPGTTEEVVKPILEEGGLLSGSDFYLAFSPEREDPGNAHFGTTTIPKVVAGDGPNASALAEAFYGAVVERVVMVSSPSTAEAVKITENIFRAVNIALVNELKVIYDAMGIDVWEVIDAAASKPFGYMPFYPGPGLGGHCIPIDPFYLTWKSREYGLSTRFIELAGEINLAMPQYVIASLERALDEHLSKSLGSAKVLIVGLAYKKNVSDIRESPSLALLKLMDQRGTSIGYFDPYVPKVPITRDHAALAGQHSIKLTPELVETYDAVIIATDHDNVDYDLLQRHSKLILDTRNAFGKRGYKSEKIIKT